MSALNGDKSRFNRERKQKIARRKRTRELLNRAATQLKPADSSAGDTAKVGVGMNTPHAGIAAVSASSSEVKKKRVLLVDTSPAKRDLRAEVMRKLGMLSRLRCRHRGGSFLVASRLV